MKRLAILISLLIVSLAVFAGGPMGNDLSGGPQVGGGSYPMGTVGSQDITDSAYALSFDGVDDFASASAALLPTGNGARTVMFWMYDSAPTALNNYLYGWGTNSGNGTIFSSMFGLFAAGNVGTDFRNYYWRQDTQRSTRWSHFVVTFPEGGTAGSATILLNGTEITSARAYTPAANSSINTGSTNGLRIAGWLGVLSTEKTLWPNSPSGIVSSPQKRSTPTNTKNSPAQKPA